MMTHTDILNNLYEVLIEANLNNPSSEVEYLQDDDPEINQAMTFIKKMNVKARAELNLIKFNRAKDMMNLFLQEMGNNEELIVKKLADKPENEPVLTFWRNFKNMSESDKASMLLDQKMLDFIKKAKDILNNDKS